MDFNKGGNPQNRNRGNFGGRDNKKQQPYTQNKPKFVKDEKRKIEKKDEKPKDDNKDDTIDLSSLDDPREEEGAEETKRGWKEEKNVADDKKDDEAGEDEEEDKKKEDTKDLDGKYGGVPKKLLHCFVCNKDMWDGESFQKHVRGRAHKQMLQSLEEGFHITVNILRENMRLAEEKKAIELNRIHRLNKNKFNRKFQEPESHCNMCDLKFMGKIITHRKTENHQRLKRFLHPNCEMCDKEFPSRMDWVDHRLTPEHLRQLTKALESKIGNEDGEIIEDRQNDQEVDLEPLLEESMEMEDESPILELSDDMGNFQNRIPAYKRSRPIATESLKEFQGFMCEICHRSFRTDELAQKHLKTEAHYYAFIDAAKATYKKQTEDSAAKEAESKKRKLDEESESKDLVETADDPSSQNGDEMYDPDEAGKEDEEPPKTEIKMETSQEDAAVPDAAEQNEVKEEQSPSNTSTPRVTRATRVGGAVKNGAGPKSRKARKP